MEAFHSHRQPHGLARMVPSAVTRPTMGMVMTLATIAIRTPTRECRGHLHSALAYRSSEEFENESEDRNGGAGSGAATIGGFKALTGAQNWGLGTSEGTPWE
jgi:hypothetical protein